VSFERVNDVHPHVDGQGRVRDDLLEFLLHLAVSQDQRCFRRPFGDLRILFCREDDEQGLTKSSLFCSGLCQTRSGFSASQTAARAGALSSGAAHRARSPRGRAVTRQQQTGRSVPVLVTLALKQGRLVDLELHVRRGFRTGPLPADSTSAPAVCPIGDPGRQTAQDKEHQEDVDPRCTHPDNPAISAIGHHSHVDARESTLLPARPAFFS